MTQCQSQLSLSLFSHNNLCCCHFVNYILQYHPTMRPIVSHSNSLLSHSNSLLSHSNSLLSHSNSLLSHSAQQRDSVQSKWPIAKVKYCKKRTPLPPTRAERRGLKVRGSAQTFRILGCNFQDRGLQFSG